MAQPDIPEQFRPQNLRSYVTSYWNISLTASVAARAVTKSTATKGTITNPEGRRAPKTIEPWGQSERDLESSIIDTILYETNPLTGADSHTCLFPCRQHVDHVGEELVRLDSEHALLLFDADTVHKPATRIVQTLLASNHIRTAVSKVIHRNVQAEEKVKATGESLVPGRISFGTHRNTVPKIAGVKRKREDDATKDTSLTSNHRGPADVFCVYSPEPEQYTIRPESSRNPSPSPSSRLESDTHTEQSITVAESSRLVMPTRRSSEEQLPAQQAPRLLYVKEGKAPHKLSTDIIGMAVGAGDKVLDVGMIMERGYSWSNDLQVEECEYWFAAVCAQLYSTMIDNNVRYGVITTGICYIFVSIDTGNPSVLRYNIAKNTLDARTSDLRTSPLIRLVSLTLLALLYHELPASPDVKFIRRRQGLEWVTGTQSFSSDGQRGKTPAMEDYNPSPGQSSSASSTPPTLNRGHGVSAGELEKLGQNDNYAQSPDTTPTASYPSPPLKAGTTVLGKRRHEKEDTPEDPDSQETEACKLRRPRLKECAVSRASILPTTTTSSPPPSKLIARRPSISSRRYCSLACMQAVKIRSKRCSDELCAEKSCPNYAEHNAVSQLTKSQLRRQVRHELVNPTHDDGWGYHWFNVFPEDSYTQMVKLVVKSHGYVLLAKAFQPQDLRNMYREASMYDRLKNLQGDFVPVCLGSIELPRDRCLWRCDVPFTGLLLLSYAGLGMEAWPRLGMDLGEKGPADEAFVRALAIETQNALSQVHEAGVLHGDLALRNVLVAKATREGPARDPEFRLKVLIIDFGRSRSISMYRQDARKHAQKQKEDSLPAGVSGPGDCEFHVTSADEIGNTNFAQACAAELAWCPKAVLRWL